MSVSINISVKWALKPFIRCGPDCIALGCRGSCCDYPYDKATGMRVTIHPTEYESIKKHGGTIKRGLLLPRPGTFGCPFKSRHGLCDLHHTPDKPFGCIASPFMLTSSNTLVIRHRYIHLPCFKNAKLHPTQAQPAYKAFATSLELIFGKYQSDSISTKLDTISHTNEFDAIPASIIEDTYDKLKTREETLHS